MYRTTRSCSYPTPSKHCGRKLRSSSTLSHPSSRWSPATRSDHPLLRQQQILPLKPQDPHHPNHQQGRKEIEEGHTLIAKDRTQPDGNRWLAPAKNYEEILQITHRHIDVFIILIGSTHCQTVAL